MCMWKDYLFDKQSIFKDKMCEKKYWDFRISWNTKADTG